MDLQESKELEREMDLDPTKKKQKLDNEDEISSTSTTIDSLPDEMLLEIFKCLSYKDKFKVQRVCSRWYQVARSENLWKIVTLSEISPLLCLKIIASLPTCVSHIQLRCIKDYFTINLFEFMAILHKHCPYLKTLAVVMTRFLPNRNEYATFDDGYALEALEEPMNNFIKSELSEEEGIEILPELRILSLKMVDYNCFSTFPQIRVPDFRKLIVLELTLCSPQQPIYESCLYASFTHVEELYLFDFPIRDMCLIEILQKAPKLRVLAVEGCELNEEIIKVLKQNSNRFEKLCLAHTHIENIRRSDADKVFFPSLQLLCLKYTLVTEKSVEDLLTLCPSLKLIDVSNCKNLTTSWYDGLLEKLRKKLRCDPCSELFCDHFQ